MPLFNFYRSDALVSSFTFYCSTCRVSALFYFASAIGWIGGFSFSRFDEFLLKPHIYFMLIFLLFAFGGYEAILSVDNLRYT